MIVLPDLDISCSALTTVSAMNESKPDVGSSTNIRGGFVKV